MTRRLYVLLALVLVACGGDDGDGSSRLTAADVQPRVDAAVLTVEDLGEGWTLDESPDDDDDVDISDEEMERCVEDEDVLAVLDDDDSDVDLGESVERSFTREDPTALAFQVLELTSGAVSDESVYDLVIDVLADAAFGDCMLGVISDAVGEDEDQIDMTFAGWDSEVDFVKGADRSVRGGADFDMVAADITLEGRMDMVIVTSGPVGTLVMAMGIGDTITDVQLEEWAETLVERQQAA